VNGLPLWVDVSVPGEVRAAMSLRFLAGGSCLDMVPLFDVVKSQVCLTFDIFVSWVIKTHTFCLTFWLHADNCEKLHELASHFGEKTGNIFCGCCGALDGIAIRIHCPNEKDGKHSGDCCCRKRFHALNVQATCDKKSASCVSTR